MPTLLRRQLLGPFGALWLLFAACLWPSQRVGGFNLWPDLPGFRPQSFYKFSNQQHDAHPTHPQPAGEGEEGLSVVDIARRRLWRWSMWRRLYHASAVTVLKHQQQPPALFRISQQNLNQPSNKHEWRPPRAFELSVPDVGPVTVASSDHLSSVYLVTRAASQDHKSLIYVNGTEVSGHLRRSVTLPSSTVELGDTETFSGSVPDAKDVSLSLHGEFSIHKPAYLHITPMAAGRQPMLWVTQFSLTSRGSVTGIDLFSPKPREMRLSHAFSWPNEVHNLPPGVVKGSSEEALLVADGFLMPGRSDGGLYIVQEPGRATEQVTRISRQRPGWFYHKAVWVQDLMGPDARACVLTARATKPFFGQSAGELVLLIQPDGPFPLADWSTPWEEMVLVRGPDVMFDVVDLDPTDDIIEVFAAEFFTQRLTLHRIRKGDWRTRRRPRVLSSEIIDDTLGPAYSVVVADLKGQGKPSHVLVSSHECQYEGMASAAQEAAAAAAAAAATQIRRDMDLEPLPVVAAAAGPDGKRERRRRRRMERRSLYLEEEEELVDTPTEAEPPPPQEPLRGGSLFAYEIPSYSTMGGGVRTWKRTTVATGFRVKTWGQINPGAPGFSYVFYPHSDMASVPGQRPSILLAGDCSHAAYIYQPVGSGDDDIKYELMCEMNCGGTVGSLAVAHLPLFGQGSGGWAKLFMPNFDTNKVYVFGFGPRRSMLGLLSGSTADEQLSAAPKESVEQAEAQRKAQRSEETAALHGANSYGRARADATKLS